MVHLAGAGIGDKRWTDDYKRQILESRTKGTDLLARTLAGLDRPPTVLVSGSAIGIYGDTGDTAVTEDGPHGHDFLADVCEPLGGLAPRRRPRPGSGSPTCAPASCSAVTAAPWPSSSRSSGSASVGGWDRAGSGGAGSASTTRWVSSAGSSTTR